jgi:RNA polymerase sporulation-specific sigma factor
MTAEQTNLVESNIRLVYYLYGRLAKTEQVIRYGDDLISEGMFGLIKAAKAFEKDKGVKFSTFAARCISNEIKMFLRRANKWTAEVSLEAPVAKDEYGGELSLADVIPDKNVAEDYFGSTSAAKDTLCQILSICRDKREIYLVWARLKGKKQKAMAEHLGLSQSYISRLITRIKRKFLSENTA